VVLSNPMAAEESVLRTSLRPGLLGALAHNAAHRNVGVRLFELGRVFLAPGAGEGPQPHEPEHLAVALGGAEAPAAVDVLDVVLQRLHVEGDLDLSPVEVPGLHPTRTAEVRVGGTAVGWVGEIDPGVLDQLDVPERVAWLELDLDVLLGLPHGDASYRPVSRFPSSDVDLAFVVAEGVSALAVGRTVAEGAGELGEHVALFDVYRGTGLDEGTRSLAYRLRLRAPDRTLTDGELAAARRAVIEAVAAAHGATLRT
jgi:phenylalanyl-tRNA synthetase beta chain